MANSILRTLFSIRMLVTLFLGFSSGLPLLVTGSTLQAWMTDQKVDLGTIGLFSLVGLPYTLKFLWSPLLDRYVLPFFGRRRGWLFVFQLGIAVSIACLGLVNPVQSPLWIAFFSLGVTFFSASQDIVADAYRREIFRDTELGLGSTVFIYGYRIAMLATGAGALFLAEQVSWNTVYLILALTMSIGLVTTFFAPEPALEVVPPRTLKEAVIEPFLDYFQRPGALGILAFILLYKVGDNMASAISTPFYLQIGFSKLEIAAVVKTFGMFATLGGSFLGGVVLVRIGMNRSLWVFGFLQMLSTFGFAILARAGHQVDFLAGVIFFENLTAGMGTAAFVAFMGSLCNRKFSATQYALLSSLMGIPRVLVVAPTGFLVEALGWFPFFMLCGLAAIPGLLLLSRFAPWGAQEGTD